MALWRGKNDRTTTSATFSTVLFLCLGIAAHLPGGAHGLLPTVCVGNVTNQVSVCCPTPDGFEEPCGGRNRGRCLRLQAHQEFNDYHPGLANDDRLMWPTRFFQYTCQCDSRFWGADCGECFFGWRGRDCNIKDVRLRRNIFRLSVRERAQYKEISRLMRVKMSPFSVLVEKFPNQSDPLRDPVFVPASVHYWLVYVHRYASRKTIFNNAQQCNQFGILDLNHGGPGFVTWHRYYTMMLERELHKIAVERFNWTTFGLPYWDWIDATWCEVCHNEIVGAPGPCDEFGQRLDPDSPFGEWDEFCTTPSSTTRKVTGLCYGCHAAERFGKLVREWTNLDLPTTEEVEYALSIRRYYIPGEFDRPSHDLENCGFGRFLEGHCGPEKFYSDTGTMHNKVHDSVTGSFCCAATAPNDPIFFMHHSQVSRIVHIWFMRHNPHPFEMANTDVSPGHNRQSYMVGFYPPIRHEQIFTDIAALGYEYDTLEFGEPVRRRLESEGLMPKPTLDHFTNCEEGFLHPQHLLHKQHFEAELAAFLAAQRNSKQGQDDLPSDQMHNPPRDRPRDPSRDPSRDPPRDPSHDPPHDPTHDPPHDPSRDPPRDPSHDSPHDPSRDPPRDPSHDPPHDPSRDPPHDPSRDPPHDPSHNPPHDPSGSMPDNAP